MKIAKVSYKNIMIRKSNLKTDSFCPESIKNSLLEHREGAAIDFVFRNRKMYRPIHKVFPDRIFRTEGRREYLNILYTQYTEYTSDTHIMYKE
ncbi:hypothetical protein TREAZ_0364 [Leadbettera azotonutricia ZAS-9]|uniref:Uncharacterized protein n=1 Tax=Leadbettera azotonutricia (strain ATCC BAA-888 / DSM 13862 / ZAS-9) TaxID=545695 RepID=F5YDG4_LEAAZ|nr:hypothetical protein TREAZ_0364 [Leadbettera azotonutricia ZAS-9]